MIKGFIQRVASSLKRRIKNILLDGLFFFTKKGVACNICGWKSLFFYSDNWHLYTICPNCSSQVRHRLFWAIINNVSDYHKSNLIENKKILHFAPEKNIYQLFKSDNNTYYTADLLAEGYIYQKIDYCIDISKMPTVSDSTFDCVIAFDVLEHVTEHIQAIKEVHRILVNDGWCIFTVPQKDDLKETYEDPSIIDPKEREKCFGQWDHLRIYGDDFKSLLSQQGFDVHIVDESFLPKAIVKRNVLFPPVLSDNPLATNYRKVYFGRKTPKLK